ncbi:MAG: hypothetical protein ACM33T_16650 [Solirubrobacterales bacterium]
MATITVKKMSLDESLGLQNTGIPSGGEDNNDNDVAISNLPSTFSTYLFTTLALDNSFPTAVGVGKSASDFISVSSTGTITSLQFTDAQGGALDGDSSDLYTLDGNQIFLYVAEGGSVVLGREGSGTTADPAGDVVFAAYLQPASNLTTATVWTVLFEPLKNSDNTSIDEPDDVGTNLAVTATESLEFHFDALPSGQNLFGIVGDVNDALVVIGRDALIKGDGTYTNASDTINTSQGGGAVTIGVDNQMFDPGDGAYFTFVTDPDPRYLAGVTGGLDQNEADDADNILYGGTLDVSSAFLKISQIQGNSLASLKLTCYDTAAEQGRAFITNEGSLISITAVRVYDAAGTLIEDTGDLAHFNSPTVSVTFSGGTATVAGLGSGYRVEWESSADHNRVLVEDVAGKFDIGAFGVNEGVNTTQSIGQNVVFEDDGPKAGTSTLGLIEEDDLNNTQSVGINEDGSVNAYTTTTNLASFITTGVDTPISFTLSTTTTSLPSLTSKGDAVAYDVTGDTLTAYVDSGTQGLDSGDRVVFTWQVSSSGSATFTLYDQLDHLPTVQGEDNMYVNLTPILVVKDADGDPATLGTNFARYTVQDDIPTIGPIDDGLVDFAANDTVTNLLNTAEGADEAAGIAITSYTSSITYPFATLTGELSTDGHTVNYFQNLGGGAGYDAGTDKLFFALTIDDSDASAANWDYTFTVYQDPPPVTKEFTFDTLPSGQNLFGVVGDVDDALIVIGRDVVLKTDGTYDKTSNTINTSQGGGSVTIGVNNQMFDPGEGAYFTFVTDPDPRYLSGITGGLDQNEADDADNILYGGTLDVASAFLRVSQIQGNSLATVKLSAFDTTAEQGRAFVTNEGTHVDITAVRVYDAAGTKIEDTADLAHFNSTSVSVSFSGGIATVAGVDAGYKVEWDTSAPQNRVLVEDVAGKFDIGGFGSTQTTPTPDKLLAFDVTITDHDGDTATDGFQIGIDGTGIYDDGIITIV